MEGDREEAVGLGVVLEAERLAIEQIRARRNLPTVPMPPAPSPPVAPGPREGARAEREPEWQTRDLKEWVEVISKAHDASHVGLALSGGGIRSATFSLGVLQALSELKLLFRIDYLSTVSGGGYIGGWLTAWIYRLREHGGFWEVQKRLATNRVHQVNDNEPSPIRFLRIFSNYLTPKLGLLNGDTWAMVGTYLRNTLLNQVTVLAVVAALLLLPRLAERLGEWVRGLDGLGLDALALAAASLFVAFWTIPKNMKYREERDAQSPESQMTSNWVSVAVPIFSAAVFLGLWRPASTPMSGPTGAAIGAAICVGTWVVTTVCAWVYEKWTQEPAAPRAGEPSLTPGWAEWGMFYVVAPVGAGALAGALCVLLRSHTSAWGVEAALTRAVPLMLGIILLAGTLQIGLMGTAFRDWRREWWGRLGGWLILAGLVWGAVFWLALEFPSFIENNQFMKKTAAELAAKYLTPVAILSTVGGLLVGKGEGAGKLGDPLWRRVVALVAPYAFVAGVVCWVSWGIYEIYPPGSSGASLLLAFGLCLLLALLMAWRVDINQFSMHLFYRNRLAACYLGASHIPRSPNRFTGLDPADDMPLKSLSEEKYDGPYPVFNASLNLVKGQDLAWQERKAASFVMTPFYCGYDVWLEEQDSPMTRRRRESSETERQGEGEKVAGSRGDDQCGDGGRDAILKRINPLRYLRRRPGSLDRYGYVRTDGYAFPSPWDGPRLGLAMAISGAAASPNMGFYTKMPLTFLMTVFNIRLGQWLGNPRDRKTRRFSGPPVGLMCLLRELLGQTDDDAAYVYLSDGGHFDNLGLYSFVKRRCGLVIVCDAEADEHYAFVGLANAIRKCRIDLGIDIELDVKDIAPNGEGEPSAKHYALGWIHYETVDVKAPTGRILYFKASLTGDEPTDVANYRGAAKAFPHETTIDQFFSESQFESYRALGHHEVMSSLRGSAGGVDAGHGSFSWPWSATKTAANAPASATEVRQVLDSVGFDTSCMAGDARDESI